MRKRFVIFPPTLPLGTNGLIADPNSHAVYGVGLRPFFAGVADSNPAVVMDVCLL
jgi:hypothetical protein